MGYELYLVKAKNWFDPDNEFTEPEYEAIQSRSKMDGLYYSVGTISIKNPSRKQIIELVSAAREFGLKVQGDDGEFYCEDGSSKQASVGWTDIIAGKLSAIIQLFKKKQPARTCPFKVGDRVKTSFRKGGVVISTNSKANHGLGYIEVKFPDGVVLGFFFIGNDLQKEDA